RSRDNKAVRLPEPTVAIDRRDAAATSQQVIAFPGGSEAQRCTPPPRPSARLSTRCIYGGGGRQLNPQLRRHLEAAILTGRGRVGMGGQSCVPRDDQGGDVLAIQTDDRREPPVDQVAWPRQMGIEALEERDGGL